MSLLDGPRAVRGGEELDGDRLRRFLEGVLGPLPALAIQQFPAGHSNLTYLVTAGDQAWVLRRPPLGADVKSAHDMGREHRLLSALAPAFPLAPGPVAACDDPEVLGAPFYLMERRSGIILRRDPPAGLALDAAALDRAFVATLAALHGLDLGPLEGFGQPDGYVERQVGGWTRRYEAAATDDLPDMAAVASWLAAHLPPAGRVALLHNDFKFDNLILDPAEPTRVTAILDWEMAAVGDPLMDLGTALSYWIEPDDPAPLQALRFGPTTLPGSLKRRELAEAYGRATGADLTHLVFYRAFGLFKTAVVGQQIYRRYRDGKTRDERFAGLTHAVRALAAQAVAAIETGLI